MDEEPIVLVDPKPGSVCTNPPRGVVSGRSPAPCLLLSEVLMLTVVLIILPRGDPNETADSEVRMPNSFTWYGEKELRISISTLPKILVRAERLMLFIRKESAAKL